VLWQNTLLRLGSHMSIAKAIHIWFLSQIVRYAPGNVWHLLGRAYLTREEGIPTQHLSLSMVFELMQTITAGLLVAALSLLFWPQQNVFGLWTLLLIPSLVFYTWPQFLQYPLEWVLKRTGRSFSPMVLSRYDLFTLLPGYCLTWLFYGCGLYLVARSIYPLPISAFPAITGIFAIAWVVGFLSFITPSGLGVREGILGYLLSTLMPVPVALLLAVLARVWLTLAELLCVAFVLWRKRWILDSIQK
jgi:hypothetical protein